MTGDVGPVAGLRLCPADASAPPPLPAVRACVVLFVVVGVCAQSPYLAFNRALGAVAGNRLRMQEEAVALSPQQDRRHWQARTMRTRTGGPGKGGLGSGPCLGQQKCSVCVWGGGGSSTTKAPRARVEVPRQVEEGPGRPPPPTLAAGLTTAPAWRCTPRWPPQRGPCGALEPTALPSDRGACAECPSTSQDLRTRPREWVC